jgi:LmbE family N-acetylglucosaminyl deacetylase
MVIPIGREARMALAPRSISLSADALRALFPALLLVPHPDDETLGCGGLIATAASHGLDMRVAFLTDGGGSHLGSPTWSRERLVEVRREEALLATGRLGVDGRHVEFLGWPDGHPFVAGDAAFEATIMRLEALCRDLAPCSIWATWEREPHADHRAAAEVADALAKRLPARPQRLSYLVWGWQLPALSEAEQVLRIDCANTEQKRRSALACHLTQTSSLIGDAVEGFRIPPELTALTREPFEYYLRCQ